MHFLDLGLRPLRAQGSLRIPGLGLRVRAKSLWLVFSGLGSTLQSALNFHRNGEVFDNFGANLLELWD